MCRGPRANVASTPFVYTKEQLVALRANACLLRWDKDKNNIPADILRRSRRGRRAGCQVQQKKHRPRPALPSVITGNVRSITGLCDELTALTRYQREFRNSALMIFTETWLTPNIPDTAVNIDNFHLLRADRTEASGKRRGGGLCVYVSKTWAKANHCTVKMQMCNTDIELFAVSIRPHHLPREFSQVIVIAVYVAPSANPESACDHLLNCISELQTKHPLALVLTTGDFNHSKPASVLPTHTQYVTFPTRGNKTLDLFFVNAKDAYTASPLPPLGRSDHDLIHLLPVYVPLVRRQPVESRVTRAWSTESEEALRDCFGTTVWTELCDPHGEDINAMTECITDYINFCFENTVPTRTVRCFSNNKPWINPEIKALLKVKKRAFRSGNRETLKTAQRELRRAIRKAQAAYKRKMEEQLQKQNTRGVWSSLRTISGYKPPLVQVEGDQQWANDLNNHFLRFDTPPPPPPALLPGPDPPSQPNITPPPTDNHPSTPQTSTPPPSGPLVFKADQVRTQLRKLKGRKAAGPDHISPRLLKSCADELCGVLERVFNLSLKLRTVPHLWKTSCVVPVPKTPHARELNSFRPVALTSHLMKTLERLVLDTLRSKVSSAMDPQQFAYRLGIGVEDAIISLLHRSLSHLEKPGSAVRILFFDFSSAFNTIQPRLLRDKLVTAGVDEDLAEWTLDYLTDRPQFVRAKNCVSDLRTCSVGAPQGTVLAPFLFTLYTADFRHNTDGCVLLKFSDDSALIGLITDDDDAEYRELTQDFVDWCQRNHLLINAGKTKEMVVDFRRHSIAPPPVNIQGRDIERVESYKYLGVHLNNKLNWTHNTEALYRKGQSRLYLLRRLRSFGVRGPLLKTFYDSVVASAILFGVVCWSSSITERDRKRLDKIIRKSTSVLGCPLDSVQEVGDRRVLAKLTSMLDHECHPLQDTLSALESSFSDRLIHPRCVKERFRRSFLPAAVRLYNEQC